jgi:hypothetical protein
MAALKGCATHVCVLTDQPFDEKHRWIELRVGSSETRLVLFMFAVFKDLDGNTFMISTP